MNDTQIKGERIYWARSYLSRMRWMNWWHQIREVEALHPQTVLEIGKGAGIVTAVLQSFNINVTTLDIDAALNPDIVASAEDIPCDNHTFDVVLAAEILEHIPWERVPRALGEIARVGRHAVISLPYYGTAMIVRLRIPLLGDYTLRINIPFFWKPHRTSGDHYWVPGARGYPIKRVRRILHDAGFAILRERIFADDYVRIFFVVKPSAR